MIIFPEYFIFHTRFHRISKKQYEIIKRLFSRNEMNRSVGISPPEYYIFMSAFRFQYFMIILTEYR